MISLLCDALFHLGNAYGKIGEYQKALDCFIRASELTPENPYYYLAAASALDRAARVEEAIALYEQVLEKEIDPRYRESVETRIRELREI